MRATRWILCLSVLVGGWAHIAPAQIPDSMMEPLFPSLGRIGAQIQTMTPDLRDYFEAPPDRGVLVSHVDAGGPAAQAGLLVADVIVGAGNRSISEPFDLLRALNRVPRGEAIDLTVIRSKGELTVRVTPTGEPNPWLDPEHWRDTLEEQLGRGAGELSEQLEKLQRRLEELEREFKEYREEKEKEGEDDSQRT